MQLPPHALLHWSELVRRCFSSADLSTEVDASLGPVCTPGGVSSLLPSCPLTGRLLVVGGGLTSAQLACQVLQCTSHAWHVDWTLRGWARVKAFDVDTEWVSPSTAIMCMAHFYKLAVSDGLGHDQQQKHASDTGPARVAEAKLRAIRAARQGGSITQEANETVQHWRRQGRLTLRKSKSTSRGTAGTPESQA